MQSFDAIVIGAGVIGCSVAYHLAHFGAKHVLVVDRLQIGAGTTSQSSGILRTHYSVPENVELAKASWQSSRLRRIPRRRRGVGRSRAMRLPDRRAGRTEAGRRCARRLARQQAQGIAVHDSTLDRTGELRCRSPLRRRRADRLRARRGICRSVPRRERLRASGAAARREDRRRLEVERLLHDDGRVVGVDTSQGRFASAPSSARRTSGPATSSAGPASSRRCAPNATACSRCEGRSRIRRDAGIQGPRLARHAVLPQLRRTQMLVSEGVAGETLAEPNNEQGAFSSTMCST